MHKMNGSAELVGTVRSGFHSSMRGRAEIDGNENFGWNGTENITFRHYALLAIPNTRAACYRHRSIIATGRMSL
jgi:hypothetical protein